MILSGHAIERAYEAGNILIDPFAAKQLNPNSYNFRARNALRNRPRLHYQ